ncbi:uracil-DNA glycosylase [Nitriliruptor alkaliphilus]|uniref:uracil-DNA glycosylase n=1 Tax=Nitriliruptor alkaliphilus TaxID=427918 RepID=UPI000697583A|nr:uracil-DNA glycosylase [Nitriliruptor alkaliphilus]
MRAHSLDDVARTVVDCRACPRLVTWREGVAATKRAAYADQTYWGRPVPGFGDPAARVVVVGLAPAAHGANRTGRMFTGDRSGDWLFASLHRTGFANQPTSVSVDDGLELSGVWITAPVKCAPPQNRPTVIERDTCAPYLAAELDLLPWRVVVALGGFGFAAALSFTGWEGKKPRFGHGVSVPLPGGRTLLGSYHVSQQNTFTGRLTEAMLDEVFLEASRLARGSDS